MRWTIQDAFSGAVVAEVRAKSRAEALTAWCAKHDGSVPAFGTTRPTRRTCLIRSKMHIALFGGPDAVRAVRAS